MKEKIQKLFQDVLSDKAALGVNHLFLSALGRNKRGVTIFEGKVDSVEIADELKIGAWIGKDDHWVCTSLEQPSHEALKEAILKAKEAALFGDVDTDYSLAPAAKEKGHQEKENFRDWTMGEFEDIGRRMETQALKSSPLVRNIPEVGAGYDVMTRIIANSNGLNIIEENGLLKAGISVMASGSDGRMVNVHEYDYWKDRASFNPDELVHEVTDQAIRRTNPTKPKSGQWPLLFTAQMAAHLFSSFNAIFSGDLLYRKLTRLEGKLGELIASPQLTLKDSGSGLISHAFDAEGTPCLDKNIIENGVLKTFIHNRYTAKKSGQSPTGNAAGGVGDIPGVGASNLLIDGVLSKNLIGSIDDGILVCELNGASSSPISGDFSYGALGYWINEGKIEHSLADFTIAGNFFTLLKNIKGIEDDLKFFGPHPLGSIGGRSILVEGLTTAGQ